MKTATRGDSAATAQGKTRGTELLKRMVHSIGNAALLLLAPVLSSCVTERFYAMTVARGDKAFLKGNADLAQLRQAREGKPATPWIRTAPYQEVSITSGDGLRLVANWLPSPNPSADLVILAHGYTGDGFQLSSFARFYYEDLGFSVLMPDARGHGRSEGDYIGFGWHERLDYQRWLAWAEERLASSARVVLHGVSMGGATVLMASGESLPDRVAAIVSDCAFSSAEAVLGYQLKRRYGLGPEPWIRKTSDLAEKRAGYRFEEASALNQVRKSRTPTLFVHGDEDSFVPTYMVHELYAACAAPKELLVVPGAGHGMAWSVGREAYTKTLLAFLSSRIPDLTYTPR